MSRCNSPFSTYIYYPALKTTEGWFSIMEAYCGNYWTIAVYSFAEAETGEGRMKRCTSLAFERWAVSKLNNRYLNRCGRKMVITYE